MHDHESCPTHGSLFLAWKDWKAGETNVVSMITASNSKMLKKLKGGEKVSKLTFLISRRRHREPAVSDRNLGNFLPLLNSEFLLRVARDTKANKKK